MSPAMSLTARDRAFADIPADVVPNYVNPETNGDYYVLGAGITLGIAGCVVLLRLVSTLTVGKKRPGVQEYLQLFALLFAIVRYVLYVVDIQHFFMGRHIWDVPLPLPDNLWGLATIGNTMYPAGMMCAKLSIVLLYLQLFGQVHKKFRYCCYALIAFDMGYLFAYFLVSIFWCQPLIAAWKISETHGAEDKCVNGYELDLTIGGLNLITDIAILILPMTIIRTLQLSMWRKIGVAAVFAIGSVAVVTVIIREVVIQQKLNNEDSDQPWAVVYEATWNSVELHIAIICGASLALPQLFRRIFQTRLGAGPRTFMRPTAGAKPDCDAHRKIERGAAKRSPKGYKRTGSTISTVDENLTTDIEMQPERTKAPGGWNIVQTTMITQSSDPISQVR